MLCIRLKSLEKQNVKYTKDFKYYWSNYSYFLKKNSETRKNSKESTMSSWNLKCKNWVDGFIWSPLVCCKTSYCSMTQNNCKRIATSFKRVSLRLWFKYVSNKNNKLFFISCKFLIDWFILWTELVLLMPECQITGLTDVEFLYAGVVRFLLLGETKKSVL